MELRRKVLSSCSMSFLYIVTLVLPVTWFPNHWGAVIGFIASGFGLSSTIFSPLQTAMVNPNNVPPEVANTNDDNVTKTSSYFVLGNVPWLMLYLAGMYSLLLSLGYILTVGWQGKCLKYVELLGNYHWFRFLHLTIGAGVLAHWKTFSFTQSDNDQVT